MENFYLIKTCTILQACIVCNLNTLSTRIYLGMVKKRKGGGREVEKEKEMFSLRQSGRLDQSRQWLRPSDYSFRAWCRSSSCLVGNLQPYIPQPYLDFLHVSSSVPGRGGCRSTGPSYRGLEEVSLGFLISFMVEGLPVSRNTLGIRRRQLSRVPGGRGGTQDKPWR